MSFNFLHLGALLIALAPSCVFAKPLILSSIKPITLIAQEIAGTNTDVDTLLPVTASHHDYPLKVSDYARLQKADVFIWIGPELESFLKKPTAKLNPEKIIVAYDLKGLNWPTSSSAAHQDHHSSGDPHLWLDPRNAVVVASAITEKLATIDSVNSIQYRANLQMFRAKMRNLDEKLQISLEPVKGVGFAVYHEGFAHFISHYKLHELDYVTFTPEQKPGAKHMHQLREKLAKEGKCLFLEPYNDMQSARDLAQELNLQTGTLDALGMQGVTQYSQLLEQMSSSFLACLANGRH